MPPLAGDRNAAGSQAVDCRERETFGNLMIISALDEMNCCEASLW